MVFGWYRKGFKFCSSCRRYIKTDGLRCPKCNKPLRSRPRKSVYKKLLLKTMTTSRGVRAQPIGV